MSRLPSRNGQCGDRSSPNSNCAPIESERARIELNPIPASQLGDGDMIDWQWEGFLAKGYITLLIGLWKAGKSTLLAYLLREMKDGGDMVGAVQPAKVLVITEEGQGLWARRRDDIGIGDNVHFLIRPFKCRPRLGEWTEFVQKVAKVVTTNSFDTVVIDTWQSVNPSLDENDAAKTMAALTPLHYITEAGAAMLLIHHPSKGDSSEARASRGSGALPGFVDTIIELRRFQAEVPDDRRRTLRGFSRFDDTPQEVVIELQDDGYRLVGTAAEANRCDRQDVIAEILGDDSMTAEQIRNEWRQDKIPKPGKRTLQADLTDGFKTGKWLRDGSGKKGAPYKYKLDSRTHAPLSAGNEFRDDSDDWGEV